MGRMGHEISFGGSHGDGCRPRAYGWDPDPNFWGRFRALVGVLASGLICSRFQASAKPVLLHWPKERKPLAEMGRVPTEETTSSCPPKPPLEEACHKLWKNLKTLPQTGKRVQKQLKSHLAAMSLSPLQDSRKLEVTHDSGAEAGDVARDDNICTYPSVATSLTSPSQPQVLRDKKDSSRMDSRSASWSEETLRARGWHKVVVRALSSQVCKPEPRGFAEPQEDWLPEEYRPPPPFAPGYG